MGAAGGGGDGPGPRPARPSRPAWRGRPWLTLLTAALGVTMVALDGTIIAMANPAIQEDLHAGLAEVQWVTNGYLLALAVALITAGRLGDRFGHRQTFLVGVAGFALASAAIGLSGNVWLVIVLRVCQGLFGALLMPAALGLLRASFPAGRLNAAIGVWAAVVGASTAAGPIIGGLLVERAGWGSVFLLNVPIGIVTLAMGAGLLPDHRAEKTPRSLDLPGVALLSGAMFCLVRSLIEAPEEGWGSGWTILLLLSSATFFVLLALWEARAREPLLPPAMFRSVPLAAGAVLMVLMAFGFIGGLFFVTFYLQNVHGMTPLESGLHLLPLTVMIVVVSPLAGSLITRTGPRAPLAGSMVLVAVALFGMSTLDADSGSAITSVWFALLGLGLAPVLVGATEVVVGSAPPEHAGVAGGLQQAGMQVGGSLGTAVLGAVMAARVDTALPRRWERAGLPPLDADSAARLKGAAEVGAAPPAPEGTRRHTADAMTEAVHGSFMSGMEVAFTVGGTVSVLAAGVALFTYRALPPLAREGRIAVDNSPPVDNSAT